MSEIGEGPGGDAGQVLWGGDNAESAEDIQCAPDE